MIAKLVTAVFQIIIGWFAVQLAGLYAYSLPTFGALFPYLSAAWVALTVWIVGLVVAGVSGAIRPPGLPQFLASLVGALVFTVLASIPDIAGLLEPDIYLGQWLPILGAVLGYLLLRG